MIDYIPVLLILYFGLYGWVRVLNITIFYGNCSILYGIV